MVSWRGTERYTKVIQQDESKPGLITLADHVLRSHEIPRRETA
jgi:hypothetical protein